MTKAEIIERIIDAMTDPYTDCAEDYLYSTPIDLHGAVDLYEQIRKDEDDMELSDDERMPEEATPALVMEAYNCLIRARKYEARTERLAAWLTHEECVCEYNQFMNEYLDDPLVVLPMDFLFENHFPFPMIDDSYPHPFFLIELGRRSKSFDPNREYCWYDREENQLFSSDIPFHDGVIDAEAFARFILLDAVAFGYMFDNLIDDEDAEYILGCTKEEYINE